MKLLKQDAGLQKWRRSGSHATIVDFDSALLQLPDHTETKIPLDADHSHIVKFDTRHAFGYRSVLAKLDEFERAAPDAVRARFEQTEFLAQQVSNLSWRRWVLSTLKQSVLWVGLRLCCGAGARTRHPRR